MSLFLNFLSELQNPEKTRNFNVFKDYSLKEFEIEVERFNVSTKQSSSYQPLRFSVIGTNGKGSTSFFLAELLKESNPESCIGLYTSPHLLSPLERIITNGNPISETEADKVIEQLKEIDESNLKKTSFFECLTLMCLAYFRQKDCKFEIWEAGLGGRLDATKVVQAEIMILTKIGIDHSEILGNTLEEIVFEKLNIASPKAKVIYSFPVSEPLKSHIERIANSLNLKIKFFEMKSDSDYLQFNFNFAKWVLRDLNLLQLEKEITFDQIKKPKGRLETISKEPLILFDPAHNPDAVRNTIRDVRDRLGISKACLLIGCLPDKDAISIWKEIKSYSWERIFFYEGPGFFQWSKHIQDATAETVQSPEELSKAILSATTPILALGSFRLYPILTTLYQNNVNL